ncbi:hypothetical protein BH18ACI4_BH18ACI4_01490 [soil metagenome]
MKVLVVHDKRGKVSSFGIPSKKFGGQVVLQAPRGKSVSEVEVPEIKDVGGSDEKDFEQVLNILKQSRIAITGDKAKLVKK